MGDVSPIPENYEELMCNIRDVCQIQTIDNYRMINSKMKNRFTQVKMREKIQQSNSVQNSSEPIKRKNITNYRHGNNIKKDQQIEAIP